MQLEKSSAFKGMRDERYLGGVIGSEVVEVEDGEEEVLVGVCCVWFRRYPVVMLGRETICEILRPKVINELNHLACFMTVRRRRKSSFFRVAQ